jgi:primosomal replication protein N
VSQTTQPGDNLCVLTARIAALEALRYTPAGIPALNVTLEHESEVQEAGQARAVKVVMKSLAFAAVAERLVKQVLGSQWRFKGFLASPRNGKGVVFHIQEFSQD